MTKDLVVDKYLENKLRKQLILHNVESKFVDEIVENVRIQMISVLQLWGNKDILNTLFASVYEEAKFYEPYACMDIKCFVVLTIRDSLYETLVSVDCDKYGIEDALSDKVTKKITSSAIEFFARKNMSKVAEEVENLDITNFYLSLKNTYPLAWNAFYELGKVLSSNSTHICYENIALFDDNVLLKMIDSNNIESPEIVKVKLNGYMEDIDKGLLGTLSVFQGDSELRPFYVPCFKGLSRNIFKLFRVLNYILYRNGVFLTPNYFISKNLIEVSKQLCRPSRCDEVIDKGLESVLPHLNEIHRDYLVRVIRRFKR